MANWCCMVQVPLTLACSLSISLLLSDLNLFGIVAYKYTICQSTISCLHTMFSFATLSLALIVPSLSPSPVFSVPLSWLSGV